MTYFCADDAGEIVGQAWDAAGSAMGKLGKLFG
jgi:hypothetical protein